MCLCASPRVRLAIGDACACACRFHLPDYVDALPAGSLSRHQAPHALSTHPMTCNVQSRTPAPAARAASRPHSLIAVAVAGAKLMHVGRRHSEPHQPCRLHGHGGVRSRPLGVRPLPLRLPPGHGLPCRPRRLLRRLHSQVAQPCLDRGVRLVMKRANPCGSLSCDARVVRGGASE